MRMRTWNATSMRVRSMSMHVRTSIALVGVCGLTRDRFHVERIPVVRIKYIVFKLLPRVVVVIAMFFPTTLIF